jgi:hypothetical protein
MTDQRTVRVFPAGGSWLLKIYEDWDTMTEEQRHEYIWEAAMDNGKVGFTYEDSASQRGTES